MNASGVDTGMQVKGSFFRIPANGLVTRRLHILNSDIAPRNRR
jgi:hypothetical protein